MNPKNFLWQFVKDGLVGVVVTLILTVPFVIFFAILFLPGMGLSTILFGMWFFLGLALPQLSVLLSILLIAFISMGIGGRFLENITSRWSWRKPILIISTISTLMGIVLSSIVAGGLGWWTILLNSALAGIGFLIASLAGVKFNPTKRMFRLIIGAISSAVFGNLLVVLLSVVQANV